MLGGREGVKGLHNILFTRININDIKFQLLTNCTFFIQNDGRHN